MNSIVSNRGRIRLHPADCRDVLRQMPDNSVDSIVTDPPYALVSVLKRFGGADAKPPKHGTDGAFARQAAGFMGETWDTGEVAFAAEFWFECLRVLKPGGYLLAFSATRTYHRLACAVEDSGFEIRDQLAWMYGSGFPKSHDQGEGRGTALKPSWEPIAMARKPFKGTIADNLREWGTGALWIEQGRVPYLDDDDKAAARPQGRSTSAPTAGGRPNVEDAARRDFKAEQSDAGRWPANVLHDGSGEVLEAFEVYSANGKSPVRFFYCGKASSRDRDEGLEHLKLEAAGGMNGRADGSMGPPVKRKNFHPTVKPTGAMRYFNRLVTPPGGIILDPFMGSGSTGKAAALDGFQFIGIEQDPRYMPIAAGRIEWAAREYEDRAWREMIGEDV